MFAAVFNTNVHQSVNKEEGEINKEMQDFNKKMNDHRVSITELLNNLDERDKLIKHQA